MTKMRPVFATLAIVCVTLIACKKTTSSTTEEKEDVKISYEVRVKNPDDSVRVEKLLQEGAAQPKDTNLPMFYAKKFIGKPYVAGTLDKDKEEGLVINTEELDCTTFVENVVALTMCTRKKQTTFADFCRALVDIRYIGGEVAYVARQHYFTIWIEDNIKDGIVSDVSLPDAPLTAKRTPHVDYMTKHVESYPMLDAHREWLPKIEAMEKQVNATTFTYIPKEQLVESKRFKEYIHDGDILCIVTDKEGLDISHLGFAIWHDDVLHLMHASSKESNGKKVLDDPMPLHQYLKQQTSSVGIRVIRIN